MRNQTRCLQREANLINRTKVISEQKVNRSFPADSDEQKLHNKILLGLPAKERELVLAESEFLELPKQMLLNEMGEAIQFAYFINTGLASFLNVMADGKSVEVGLAGKEGFTGLPLTVGFDTSPARVVMQVEGTGFRMSAADFKGVLRLAPGLQKSLNRFSLVQTMQATQIAACNRLHEVDRRLARWLLMSQDRLGGDVVGLTQESLANMLGTRRASVTEAAGVLQKAELISYKRGDLKIEDRRGLEAASCECYGIMKRLTDRWQRETGNSN